MMMMMMMMMMMNYRSCFCFFILGSIWSKFWWSVSEWLIFVLLDATIIF